MGLLSTFYGIIVRMNSRDHNPPHFHVQYQNYNAILDFDGNVLEGEFPANKLKLVSAWTEIHKDELFANWELASNNENTVRIEPLK